MELSSIKPYIFKLQESLRSYYKEGVDADYNVYPFSTGCIIVIKFKVDSVVKGKVVIKETSSTYEEALKMTQLFVEESIKNAIAEQSIHYMRDKIMVVKLFNNSDWSAESAESDAKLISTNVGRK